MSDRTTQRRAAWCSLAVASILLVTGCSRPDANASSPQTTAPPSPGVSLSAAASETASPPSTPSETDASGSASSAVSAAPNPPATDAPQQVLASRGFTGSGTFSQSPVRMRLDVVELKRRGDLLDLTANLTNLEQDRSRDLRWQVSTRFQGPYRKDITSYDGAFSGAVLTDVAGKKRYLVAADSGTACVCTVQLNSMFVGAGQTVELSATYAAPPVSTTKLDVTITSIGTFRDLPIT